MQSPTRFPGLEVVRLDDENEVFAGLLPEAMRFEPSAFERLWDLHPAEPPLIRMHGKSVRIPRWQQAFGQDYRFSGTISAAAPLPPMLEPLLRWSRETIDERLNGILANWYDAALGHDIGAHRDHTRALTPGVPIVITSFGARRVLRLRPWRGRGFTDLPATHGSVVVIPFATNRRWTHEVPLRKTESGRRISLTIRSFRRANRAGSARARD